MYLSRQDNVINCKVPEAGLPTCSHKLCQKYFLFETVKFITPEWSQSYGQAKWWIKTARSDGWRNKWVGNNEVDEEMKGVGSRNKVNHNERSDQLFLERMMSVDEQK